MSLRSLWSDRAMAKRHADTLRRLRVAADETTPAPAVEHIMVAETRNALGGVTKWGGNSQLCSSAILGTDVISVRPYRTDLRRVCDECSFKLSLITPKPILKLTT